MRIGILNPNTAKQTAMLVEDGMRIGGGKNRIFFGNGIVIGKKKKAVKLPLFPASAISKYGAMKILRETRSKMRGGGFDPCAENPLIDRIAGNVIDSYAAQVLEARQAKARKAERPAGELARVEKEIEELTRKIGNLESGKEGAGNKDELANSLLQEVINKPQFLRSLANQTARLARSCMGRPGRRSSC